MYKLTGTFLVLLPFVTLAAAADSPVWGQCGGIGWSGPTTCASGTYCNKQNDWYSQCIPGSGGGGSTTGTTPTSTSSSPGSTSTATGLNNVAKADGKLYFGSAVDNSELSDSTLMRYIADTKEFGQITPGNSMKWDATEPSRGSFSFSGGDAIANLAKKNGQLLRAHALLWHNQLPNWVTSTRWSKSDLTTVIQNHIAGVAGHYKGVPYAWDVVNEPVADDGTWRQSVFYTTFGGSDFIDVAFKAARATDPNAKLYLNDYNLEYAGAKFNTTYNKVKQLVADGVPIDGVGFQAHMIVGSMPTDIGTRLKAFTDLGLEVAFTELDIRMDLPATQASLQQQKKDYQTIVSTCAQLPKCVGVTTWGFTDAHSWVPGTFPGTGAALIWDSNYNKKPAYDGIVAAFTS